MIAHVAGTLLAKALDRVEVMTPGGVGYELSVPLSVYETLPNLGDEVRLMLLLHFYHFNILLLACIVYIICF